MKIKLICLFLFTGLLFKPLVNKHSNAILPSSHAQVSNYDSNSEVKPSEDKDFLAEVAIDREHMHDTSQDKIQKSDETPSKCEMHCAVGRYLHTKGKKCDQTESHHLISAAFCREFGLIENDAPAICLQHELHVLTGSHGSRPTHVAYHDKERQILYDAMRQNPLFQTLTDEDLKRQFRLMSGVEKYKYLKPVLDFGIDDLAQNCGMSLKSNPKCMEKLHVELHRLSGIQLTNHPLFTPKKRPARNVTFVVHYSRTTKESTCAKATKRPRSDDKSPSDNPAKRRNLDDSFLNSKFTNTLKILNFEDD